MQRVHITFYYFYFHIHNLEAVRFPLATVVCLLPIYIITVHLLAFSCSLPPPSPECFTCICHYPEKSPRSGVRSVTSRAVGRVRVGVKVISLCLQLLPPSPPMFTALSLMLLVSWGIFVLNSCEFGIKNQKPKTIHNVSTSVRLSSCRISR